MLRRAASLLGRRAAWLRRHPEARPGHRPPAPLRYLDDVRGRGYARMARRIPPARPHGYSTSDDETDAYGDEEDLELGAASADGEEGAAPWKKWEGYMLYCSSGTDEEEEEEDSTEVEEADATDEERDATEEKK